MHKLPGWLAIFIGSLPVSLIVVPLAYLREWRKGRSNV